MADRKEIEDRYKNELQIRDKNGNIFIGLVLLLPLTAAIALRRFKVFKNMKQTLLGYVGMTAAMIPVQARFCDDFYREEYSEREVALLKYSAVTMG